MVCSDFQYSFSHLGETLPKRGAGTATDYRGWDLPNEQDYEAEDPRHWRDKCEGRTLRLQDFLREWKNRFMSLEWICVPTDRWQLWWESIADDDKLRELNVWSSSALKRLSNAN
jgi:hypothetical protein